MDTSKPENVTCRLDEVSPLQQDVLQELVNIGMGRAAGALNQMTRSHVELQAPAVRVVRMSTLARFARGLLDSPLDVVRLRFSGSFSGVACLFFAHDPGTDLVKLLFGGQDAPEDLTPFRSDTLREVGNIVLIWIMGAIGNAIGFSFTYDPLDYMDSLRALMPQDDPTGMALLIKATFKLRETVVQGDILILFDGHDCVNLLEAVDSLVGKAS